MIDAMIAVIAELEQRVAQLEGLMLSRPAPVGDAKLQQALDTIDAYNARRRERLLADQKHQGAEQRAVTLPTD